MKSHPSCRAIPAATHTPCLLLGCCALAAVTLHVHAETYIWAQDDTPVGGNWNLTTAAGWVSAGTYPRFADDIATVNKNIAANQTITINVNNAKCGELFLSDNQSSTTDHWNIGTDANNYPLTFEVTSGKALLNIGRAANGAVQFAAPIKLNSDLQIRVQGTSPGVNITKQISDGTGSHGIEKIDSDVLILSAVSTYSGDTIVTLGTLQPTVVNAIPYGPGKGNVIINGGTLDIRANAAINGLSGGGGVVDIVAGGGARTLTVGNNDQTSAYSGAIKNTTGTLNLTKSGSGTLTLSGANTYGGITTVGAGALSVSGSINSSPTVNVNGGTLSTTGANKLANVAVVTVAGGTLTVGGNDTIDSLTLSSGAVGGSGILTATTYSLSGGAVSGNLGAGTLNSSGDVAFSGTALAGTVNVTAGTLTLGGANRLAATAAVAVSGGTLALGGDETIDSLALSSGDIVIGGSGVYGTLSVNGDLALTGGTLAFDLNTTPAGANDTLALTGNLHLDGSTTVDITFDGLGAGTYPLLTYGSKSGTGTLTPVYHGALSRGMTANLVVPAGSGAGTVSLVVTVSPLSLVWAGDGVNNTWDTSAAPAQWLEGVTPTYFADLDHVTFDTAGAANSPVQIPATVRPGSLLVSAAEHYVFLGAGKISGATGLTKAGPGTLTLGAVNDYTGSTEILGGAVSVAALANGGDASPIGAATSDPANLVLDGARLTYTGATAATDRGLTLNAGGGVVEVTGAGANLTVGGQMVGTAGGGLTKTGTGALTLTRHNTYDGVTTVHGGTLMVTGTHSGGGLCTVQPGGTLAGTGAVGAVTVQADGWLSPGSAAVSGGTLTTGNLALQGGAKLAFDLGTAADKILAQGELNVGTGVLGFSDFVFSPGAGFGPTHSCVLIDAMTLATGCTLDPDDLGGLINGLPFSLVLAPATAELVLVSGTGQGSMFTVR